MLQATESATSYEQPEAPLSDYVRYGGFREPALGLQVGVAV